MTLVDGFFQFTILISSGADSGLPEQEQMLNDTFHLADFRRRRKKINFLHLFVFKIVLYFKKSTISQIFYFTVHLPLDFQLTNSQNIYIQFKAQKRKQTVSLNLFFDLG